MAWFSIWMLFNYKSIRNSFGGPCWNWLQMYKYSKSKHGPYNTSLTCLHSGELWGKASLTLNIFPSCSTTFSLWQVPSAFWTLSKVQSSSWCNFSLFMIIIVDFLLGEIFVFKCSITKKYECIKIQYICFSSSKTSWGW